MSFFKKNKNKKSQNKDIEQIKIIFDENSVIKNTKEFDIYETKRIEQISAIKKAKPQINKEKVELLKHKFNFLRKIKPLKFRKFKLKDDKEKFDPKKADKNKHIDINAIWEKPRRKRNAEEKYYYRKEVRTYHKNFLLYLTQEIHRTRWTSRKQLNVKFWQTILFIAFFAILFALLQTALIYLFQIIKLT